MTAKSEVNDQPATFAEGVPVPTVVPQSPESVQSEGAPSDDDYAREWGTYRARQVLTVDGQRAVSANAPVPASHPMVEEWLKQEVIERIDGKAVKGAARAGRERDA